MRRRSRCASRRSSTCTGCAATSSPTSTRWQWKTPRMHPELDPATYGLTIWDLDREFLTGGLGRHASSMTLGEILHVLRDAYCRTIGIEYMHIQDTAEQKLDPAAGRGRAASRSSHDEQRHILDRLNAAEAFEKFLATKYVGQKRFGLEGAESRHRDPRRDPRRRPPTTGLDGVVIGMAHRGRLNVLANIVGKSYDQIFKEFEGNVDPDVHPGLGRREVPPRRSPASSSAAPAPTSRSSWPRTRRTSRRSTRSSSGMARAKQDLHRPARRATRCCRSSMHGDAAFAGQGVVAETLNLSRHQGLPRRRHDPPGHQQPARLHHRRPSRPARRSTRPTSPRWSRRRSST